MAAFVELLTLQWRWPAAFALLALPVLWALWTRQRERQVLAYADEALRPWAFAEGSGRSRDAWQRWRTALRGLAWCLICVALAGPRWPMETAAGGASDAGNPVHEVDVIVVLDRSASMRETDVAPDRATRARLELTDLLGRLQGERLGLVLLTAEPGLALPLTRDRAVFEDMLQLVTTPGAAGQAAAGTSQGPAGGDFASALRVAAQALQGSRPGSRTVLLVTDAEAGDLAGEAGEALRTRLAAVAEAQIPVFVWAMSDPRQPGGEPQQRQPDHAAWGLAVGATGGRLVAARAGQADLEELYESGLARLAGAPADAARVRVWQEAYRAPLALGLLLWLLVAWPGGGTGPSGWPGWHRFRASRRADAAVVGPAVSAVVMTLLISAWPGPVDAQPALSAGTAERQRQTREQRTIEREAWAAWQAGRWSQAETLYARLGTADALLAASAAALRAGDGPGAQRWASRALWMASDPQRRLDALHNLGHAHALQLRWEVAAEAWAAVLAARPGDARAATNLAVAQAELAKRGRHRGGPSDLRGRRGFTLEGLASTEGMDGREPPALPVLEGRRRATEAADQARIDARAAASSAAPAVPDARQLASGLAKMSRLDDARQALVRGLVRQDRDGSGGKGLSPW